MFTHSELWLAERATFIVPALGSAPSPLPCTFPQDLPCPPGPGQGGAETPTGPTLTDSGRRRQPWNCRDGQGKPVGSSAASPGPRLSTLMWQAAKPGVGAVTDRLVIGKLPSLAQECCLVTMVTFTTRGLTKAQGICYLKPAPRGALGFGIHAYR